ncbi:MAG: chemotaxis protein CheA [Clostridia bacterium]|nr:chemotaxis protein CheA [Clostridia bacterium]
MKEMLSGYMEDMKDSLLILNDALIKIQNSGADASVINSIFRVAHTMKGNSAAMNFMKIEKVMHTMEDILQEVRNGDRELTEDIIRILFACHDFLEDCIEIISNAESDVRLNTDILQNKLEQLKGGKEGDVGKEAIETETYDALSREYSELLQIIEENCRRGFTVCKITVTIDPDCMMKTVRAWLVFEELDGYGSIVFSKPERPSEEEFRNDTCNFEWNKIELLLLTEKEADSIASGIRNIAEVIDVSLQQISPYEVRSELERKEKEEEILKILSDIGVHILDCGSRETHRRIIGSIIGHFERIAASDLPEECSFVKKAASELVKALNAALEDNQQLTEEDMEMLAYVCKGLEISFKTSGMLEDSDYQAKLDEHLLMLKSRCEAPNRRIGDILLRKGLVSDKDIEDILNKQRESQQELRFGQVAVKENKVNAYDMLQALKEQGQVTEKKENTAIKAESGFIRIPVGKVDNLMDMLGELLILNSQLEQRTSETGSYDLGSQTILSRTAKIIKGIQALSMSLRMVEVKSTLHRLTRIARDTAAELQKGVVVSIEGEDTEIDRSAAEKIFDPLMHLVRNAVSHGIEEEQERLEKGKKPEGQITIRAYSKRGNVYVEVSDDGRGLDTSKILKKAQALGMTKTHEEYSEEEIIRFIFLPGFSTQEKINSISGRGVGMNVVEEEIKKVGGRVEIQNCPGNGCTFTIRIPMNLAVVNGTIVEVCGGRYIVPTLFIKEFFIVDEKQWVIMQGKAKAVRLREHVIPVLQPEVFFGEEISKAGKERCELVIVELEQKLLAFPVDRIIVRQEIVSKPLGTEFNSIDYASGASILGDGVVSLILDVEDMFKKAGL